MSNWGLESNKRGYLTMNGMDDFLFAGASIVPSMFIFTGNVEAGVMAFCLLLIPACLIAAAQDDAPFAIEERKNKEEEGKEKGKEK
jgi:hypothetical protein